MCRISSQSGEDREAMFKKRLYTTDKQSKRRKKRSKCRKKRPSELGTIQHLGNGRCRVWLLGQAGPYRASEDLAAADLKVLQRQPTRQKMMMSLLRRKRIQREKRERRRKKTLIALRRKRRLKKSPQPRKKKSMVVDRRRQQTRKKKRDSNYDAQMTKRGSMSNGISGVPEMGGAVGDAEDDADVMSSGDVSYLIRRVYLDVIDWQNRKNVSSLPSQCGDQTTEVKIGKRLAKALLRRNKAVGPYPSERL